MATRGIGTGLLSKVAKFVLNPTVDWVDLDKPPVVPEEVNSKHALKQMIERKQYNDAVRKREFDKLRKLRRSAVPDMTNATQPPTSDQDSWGYAVYQERANTLKKIDEIEAVSYTHLDVYKRQSLAGAARSNAKGSCPAGSGACCSNAGIRHRWGRCR